MNQQITGEPDRDVQYREFFDGKQREYLRTLVCEDVIEEHRLKPLGQHSEPLERLLIYFRRRPLSGQYILKRLGDSNQQFQIMSLSGQRGNAPALVSNKIFTTLESAYHAIFLKHIKNLMES